MSGTGSAQLPPSYHEQDPAACRAAPPYPCRQSMRSLSHIGHGPAFRISNRNLAALPTAGPLDMSTDYREARVPAN